MTFDGGFVFLPVGAGDNEQPKGFFKLPTEIRVKIYELLLLPPPAKRVECCGDPIVKQCSPGGRLLASTCKPVSSAIRTFDCQTCSWRGADVHTDIIAVNRQIHEEAMAVLYENTRLVLREGRFSSAKQQIFNARFSREAFEWIKHFQLSLQTADQSVPLEKRDLVQEDHWPSLARYCAHQLRIVFHNLKHATLHFDVDLTVCDYLDASQFAVFADCAHLDFLVEVHIIRAWDGDDDWKEMVECRSGNREFTGQLNERAEQLKADFERDLARMFEAQGRKLKLREC